jgi:hypothetical protein
MQIESLPLSTQKLFHRCQGRSPDAHSLSAALPTVHFSHPRRFELARSEGNVSVRLVTATGDLNQRLSLMLSLRAKIFGLSLYMSTVLPLRQL